MTSQRTILETVAIARGKQVLLQRKLPLINQPEAKPASSPWAAGCNPLLQCQAPVPELSAPT